MITSNDFVERLQVRPFQPFRVITSSGQAYEITHPELVWVQRRHVQIAVPSLQYPGLIERSSTIGILHVSEIQTMAEAASTASNGQP